MSRRPWPIVLGALALVAAACGGTYHPEHGDQALVSSGPVAGVAGPDESGETGEAVDGTTPTTASVAGGANRPGGSRAASTGANGGGAASAQGGSTEPTGAGQTAVRGGVIKIGAVNPLSGPIGSIGRSYVEGAHAVFELANEQGGVHGARIQFLSEDDQFDPVQGRRKVQKLIGEGVFAFSTMLNPSTLEQSLSDLEAAGTPVLPTDGAGLTFGSKLLFSPYQGCERNFAGNAEYAVRSLGVTRIAVIRLDIEAARGCMAYAVRVVKTLGAEVVYEGITSPAAPDCVSHVINARGRDAELVFGLSDNLGMVKCVNAARQQGWDVPFTVSANLVDDPAVLRGLGKNAEGLLSSTPFPGINSPEFEAYCGQAIRRFFPDAELQFFHIIGCLGAHILLDALRQNPPDTTGPQLAAFLESGVTFDYGDLSPPVRFRAGDHKPFDATRPVQVKDGKWVPIGEPFTPVEP